ncbi:MAG: hypothetical protein ACRC2R_16890 [Xenococcaceae cyanobacterium]
MTIQKDSLLAANGSIQTFKKDGLHLQTEAITEYILLELSSLPINTTRFFKLRDRLLTLQPLVIWFTPSVANQTFTFAIRQDTTILYSLAISSGQSSANFPIMLVKPFQDIVLTTPAGLSLTNVLIICKEVAYSEIVNGV